MRELVPWWGRIGAKMLLSRLPTGYEHWRKLRIFRHGEMDDPRYALAVFRSHCERAQFAPRAGFVALELGPGDSLASAVIAAAHGAGRTHLVDVGPYATTDLPFYQGVSRHLREIGLAPPELGAVQDTRSLLDACRATYGTCGLESMRDIPARSVDFLWSHAVLEHVRRGDFAAFIAETRRVLREGGVCSHQVDLQDHLGGALNNLRIASSLWEREWMAGSGFYTNRLSMSEMLHVFKAAGFQSRTIVTARWEHLPTPRGAFAGEFRERSLADLLVKSFAVTLTAS